MTTAIAAKPRTDIERRAHRAEIRSAAGDPAVIEGYAVRYEERSVDLGFIETMAKGSCRKALAKREPDTLLLFGHDPNIPLARRSTGQLEVRETPEGVWFRAKLPDTQAGRDAAVLVSEGIVKGCSFAFTTVRDDWDEDAQGRATRRVLEVGSIPELTLTAIPAYESTSVSPAARSALSRIKETNPVTAPTRPRARSLADLKRRSAATRATLSPYGPGSRHSWFRDRFVAAVHAQRQHAAIDTARGWAGEIGAGLDSRAWSGSPAREALTRLAAVARRDVTTSDPGAAGFVPTGAPGFIAEAIATSVRARGVAPSIFPTRPLPPYGEEISTGRITTAATVATQAVENTAVSETDIDTQDVLSPVATIAGLLDLSAQAFERTATGGELDAVIAAELGGAYAAELDRHVLNGSAAAGELLGLLNVTGTTSNPYADASPTLQELWPVLLETRSDVAAALGYSPSVILLHPRRHAWMLSQRDTAGNRFSLDLPDTRWIEAPALPVTLGAGAEDAVLVIEPAELPLYVDQPVVEVFPEVGSANLTVRVRLRNYCASLAHRRPEAIGKITGSGLTTPVFA